MRTCDCTQPVETKTPTSGFLSEIRGREAAMKPLPSAQAALFEPPAYPGRLTTTKTTESGEERPPLNEGRCDMPLVDLPLLDHTPPSGRHPLSQEFHNVLLELGNMHDLKQKDYGRPDDPFANVRGSEDFGIEPWVGAVLRGNDKMRRLQIAAKGGSLSNEGIEDSLLDLAVYSTIGLVLYREMVRGMAS